MMVRVQMRELTVSRQLIFGAVNIAVTVGVGLHNLGGGRAASQLDDGDAAAEMLNTAGSTDICIERLASRLS